MHAFLGRVQDWIVEESSLGVIHKSLREVPQAPEELFANGTRMFNPKDLIDEKVKGWHKLWRAGDSDAQELDALLHQVREATQCDQMPPLTNEDVRGALRRMKARAGLGVDRLSPLGFERLPECAITEL
eukprot:8049296-Pyramimonas_sp.AAC.1